MIRYAALYLLAASAAAQVPQITSAASAASFETGQISVGSYVSIFGINLADATYVASVPYPAKLGSTEIFVCSFQFILLPLALPNSSCRSVMVEYASPTQVNVVLDGVADGYQNYFIARVNGVLDAGAQDIMPGGHGGASPYTARIYAVSPALFLAGRDCPIDNVPAVGGGPRWTGVGQNCGIFPSEPIPGYLPPLILPSRANRGVITDASGNIVWSGNPARIGSYYTIWLTGLGAAPSTRYAGVGFDNIPAYGYPNPTGAVFAASYAGAVPQFPGLYQVNFQMPQSVATGPLDYGAWPCGDYSWELSLYVPMGGAYSDGVDFPLVIKNGDVPCKP